MFNNWVGTKSDGGIYDDNDDDKTIPFASYFTAEILSYTVEEFNQ